MALLLCSQLISHRCQIAGLGFIALAENDQDLPDLEEAAQDLSVPEAIDSAPAAGRRVRETTPGWEADEVHHTLWLPEEWSRWCRAT